MQFTDIESWDRLGDRDSFIHSLDPRAKLVTAAVFILTIMSFGKYEISALIPFFLYPVVMVTAAGIPAGRLAVRIAAVSMFAVLIGIFNPVFDRQVLVVLGPLPISGGWISFLSILLRFMLTAAAALLLLATTGIFGICLGLHKIGVPQVLVTQILLLYRYLFVLADEAAGMMFARSARAFGGKGMGIRVCAHILGAFILRSIERSHRIHNSMLSRGFAGRIRTVRQLHWRMADSLFAVVWILLFLLLRTWNIAVLTGDFCGKMLP